MIAIRHVVREGHRLRDEVVNEVVYELGFRRVGPRIRQVIEGDLIAASMRGVTETRQGMISICCRTIDDYDRDFLREVVLKVIGRKWSERSQVVQTVARHLGFARTGPRIQRSVKSAMRILVRRGELERDGDYVRRS